MSKKVSESQKKEMVENFIGSKTISELSEKYKCTKITVTRHLRKSVSETAYKEYIKKNNYNHKLQTATNSKENQHQIEEFNSDNRLKGENLEKETFFADSPFVEITPIEYVIDTENQKDLSSTPISNIELPKTVYLIVDKNTELEIKLLKDYIDWQFLSETELNRKTIKIYHDLKIAKKSCNKEQKVIKVPNSAVFKIVSPILIKRGITRIISAESLVAL